MPVHITLNEARVPVKVFTNDIEHDAIQQLLNVAQLPIVHGHVAAMPDVHHGIGATVGSVIPTKQAIIPAAVGVDIGCGMNAIRLTLHAKDLPDSLAKLRSAVEACVPVGFNQHDSDKVRGSSHARQGRVLDDRLDKIVGKHPGVMKMQRQFARTWLCQLGTLGGGNHFIELCLDEEQRVWVMLHSGSRGVGNVFGRYFIAAARKDMGRHQIHLPDRDLAYFSEGSDLFDDYVEAVDWAQDYALLNRSMMMKLVLDALAPHLPAFKSDGEAINCHHNYVAVEHHFGEKLFITRKGCDQCAGGSARHHPGQHGCEIVRRAG